jgi:KaiC/GvpD/RAD55 family RecA-like ATPase
MNMSGEEEKNEELRKNAEKILSQMAQIMATAKGQEPSEWEIANAPFKKPQTEEEIKSLKIRDYIGIPKDETVAKKELIGFKTGTFIDLLYLNEEDKPLNGIPIVGQIGVVGLSGVGKSILLQEVAVRTANEGKKVVYITSEDIWESPSPRFDLQSRLKSKAETLGIDWKKIQDNLIVLDTISNSELRDFPTLIETYRYIVENSGVDLLIIDSLTLLETYRGVLKYRILELSRYNQIHGITGLYASQRAEEETDRFSMAGGIGVAHNLDSVICIDFAKAMGELKDDINLSRPKDNQLKQWDLIHFARILSCRLCGFDRKHYEVTIDNKGFLKRA